MSGNARDRRRVARVIKGDHRKWPLGTSVLVLAGHHSPDAVNLLGRVSKHGYPCVDGVNCNVEFARPIYDRTFGAARYSHYVAYRHLRRTEGAP